MYIPRTKTSYRRPIPPATAITSEVVVLLPNRCTCGGKFTHITVHDHYVEDIPLPELTPSYQSHLVTKQNIQAGVCERCGKAATAQGCSGQAVRLGPNVRLLVTHLVTVGGMSYAQVASLLLALYGLKISDGEVSNLLQKQHEIWLPAYHQLRSAIRAAPIRHYDETPWHIQAADNGGYVWVMSDDQSNNTLFRCASSRGTRHAASLHGNASGVHITDDYGPYRNLSGQQQLCWAHLYRAIRDLRYNDQLPETQVESVVQW
jgi:transposase